MSTIAVEIDKDKLRDFCKRWKVTEFALFGSVLREDFSDQSDIDVLVSFAADTHWTFFDMVDMKEELEAILGRKVDLLTRYGVEHMRNYLRRSAILESVVLLDVA